MQFYLIFYCKCCVVAVSLPPNYCCPFRRIVAVQLQVLHSIQINTIFALRLRTLYSCIAYYFSTVLQNNPLLLQSVNTVCIVEALNNRPTKYIQGGPKDSKPLPNYYHHHHHHHLLHNSNQYNTTIQEI